jgi:MATE family multidrug resistance protein
MWYGLPSGFHFFLDVICFSFFILLVGRLGTDDLAATNLAFNLNTLAFVPMFGLGTAVMTLVGQRIGEGKPELAVRTTWIAFGIGFVHMSVFGAIYLLAPDLFLMAYAAYTEPAEFDSIRSTVVVLLRFVAIYGIFDAMNIIFGAAVRGAGDTRFSMIFSALSGWFVMVVPTYIALAYFDGGVISAWSMITLNLVVLGFGYMARFQGGKWKSMRVIETTTAAAAPDPALAAVPIPLTDDAADATTMECTLR